jgi:hypothetical protein
MRSAIPQLNSRHPKLQFSVIILLILSIFSNNFIWALQINSLNYIDRNEQTGERGQYSMPVNQTLHLRSGHSYELTVSWTLREKVHIFPTSPYPGSPHIMILRILAVPDVEDNLEFLLGDQQLIPQFYRNQIIPLECNYDAYINDGLYAGSMESREKFLYLPRFNGRQMERLTFQICSGLGGLQVESDGNRLYRLFVVFEPDCASPNVETRFQLTLISGIRVVL